MIRSLRTAGEMYAAAHGALPQQRKRWLVDHRAIVAACSARQAREAVGVRSTSHAGFRASADAR